MFCYYYAVVDAGLEIIKNEGNQINWRNYITFSMLDEAFRSEFINNAMVNDKNHFFPLEIESPNKLFCDMKARFEDFCDSLYGILSKNDEYLKHVCFNVNLNNEIWRLRNEIINQIHPDFQFCSGSEKEDVTRPMRDIPVEIAHSSTDIPVEIPPPHLSTETILPPPKKKQKRVAEFRDKMILILDLISKAKTDADIESLKKVATEQCQPLVVDLTTNEEEEEV